MKLLEAFLKSLSRHRSTFVEAVLLADVDAAAGSSDENDTHEHTHVLRFSVKLRNQQFEETPFVWHIRGGAKTIDLLTIFVRCWTMSTENFLIESSSFVSIFEDIEWHRKGFEEKTLANAELTANFAESFF